MNIHAVVWDVGGVLVRTEDWNPRNQLAERYGLGRQEINDLVFGSGEHNPVQLGEVSTQAHWAEIGQKLGLTHDEVKAFEDQFFAGDALDQNLVEHIRQLHGPYCTAILSNAFDDLRQVIAQEWQIDDAFHHIIVSAEVGLMKPNPAIYRLTLETIGFAPEETVFIDDMPHNIKAAKDVGMHGILFQNPPQALAELERLVG